MTQPINIPTPSGSVLYAERVTPPCQLPELSLWASLRTQIRVIGALVIRESLTRYGRHNIGFLWLFLEPMIFTLGVTAAWTMAGLSKGGGLAITEFMLTGYSTMLLWRNMPNRCVLALPPNYDLLFHRQVKPIDILFARCILEAVGATMSFVVLSLVFFNLGWATVPDDFLTVAAGWFLLMWYAFSVSILVGAISERSEALDKVWHIVQYIMIPLSGSLFMLAMLPEQARSSLLWIPSVSCAELIREGFFGARVTSYYSIGYVIIFNSIVLLFGLAQLRIVSRSLTPA